jgi:ornithine cyclodeaminase
MGIERPDATFALYDEIPNRRDDLAADLADEGLSCVGAKTVAEAVDGAEVIFTVTTATSSYLSYSWISPGALIAHISLDDVEPEVVRRADLLLVDDFELVSNDQRRLLGRMFQAGELLGPGGECADKAMPGARRIDGTLADVLRGKLDRQSPQGIVLSNPFGMGILDVAIAAQIVRVSESLGLGVMLDF